MKTTVIIDIDIVGFHLYPNAPNVVSFLRNNHRHIFKVKLGFIVSDLDREIEIFMITDEVSSFLYNKYGNPCNFGQMSCEHIATELMHTFECYNCSFVEVFEDNRGGARIDA